MDADSRMLLVEGKAAVYSKFLAKVVILVMLRYKRRYKSGNASNTLIKVAGQVESLHLDHNIVTLRGYRGKSSPSPSIT